MDNGVVAVECELSKGAAATVVLWFRTGASKARYKEGERAKVSEHGACAVLKGALMLD